MIFQNSPFEMLDKAFKNLYPDKSYIAFIDVDMKDESGEKVYGCTQFNDGDTPIIFIDASLSIQNAVEIFAHELVHVAEGENEGHGELWEKTFDEIQDEYNKIGEELCKTAKQIFWERNTAFYLKTMKKCALIWELILESAVDIVTDFPTKL